MTIRMTVDFSKLPGEIDELHGTNTGEKFRNNYLIPVYDYCLVRDENLNINFCNSHGYAASFLEEAFGGMVRNGYDGKQMLRKMNFKTEEEPLLEDSIVEYIIEAIKNKSNCKVKQKKK